MSKCKCGCGKDVRPNRQYIHGHNLKQSGCNTRFKSGQVPWNRGRPAPWAMKAHKGKPKALESIVKRTQTRRDRFGGAYNAPGMSVTERRDHNTWLKHVTEANRSRDISGSKNPFYGKTHTEKTRKILSQKLSGSRNSGWNNGASTLPYGPEFTRKFKRMIRERDNQTCQRCAKTRKQIGRTLQVHHIDHDKMNNDPINLVTVCGSCNVWFSYHRENVFCPPSSPIG